MPKSVVPDGGDFEHMMSALLRRVELLERRAEAAAAAAAPAGPGLVYARRSNASGLVINNVTNTAVQLSTVDWDYGAMAPGNAFSLTAPTPGMYFVSYTAVYSNTTGSFRVAFWMETSLTALTRFGESYASAHNPGARLAGSDTVFLDAGTTVTLWTYHDRGASYDIVGARLLAALVRPLQGENI